MQPQVFRVFAALVDRKNDVVTRPELFDECWGRAAVGDDSLNRTLASIRRSLRSIGSTDVVVETVPQTGYRISVSEDSSAGSPVVRLAIQQALDSLRLGMPTVDASLLASMRSLLKDESASGSDLGVCALVLRRAAEYGSADSCHAYVEDCQIAVREALKKEPSDPHARLALLTLPPLIGNWTTLRRGLDSILSEDPNNLQGRHEMAVLEMATGRASFAAPIIERLIDEDGLAAAFAYKRIYHLWTLGDLQACEMAIARAMLLWPRHPAIWIASYWVFLSCGHAGRALNMAQSEDGIPGVGEEARDFIIETASVLERWQDGTFSGHDLERHIARTLAWGKRGPPQAVFSFMSLCVLGATDAAFEIARGYYLGEGEFPSPHRSKRGDPSITDQYRRITQFLFIPAAETLRQEDRFGSLCTDIGLTAHWDDFCIVPDFRRTSWPQARGKLNERRHVRLT